MELSLVRHRRALWIGAWLLLSYLALPACQGERQPPVVASPLPSVSIPASATFSPAPVTPSAPASATPAASLTPLPTPTLTPTLSLEDAWQVISAENATQLSTLTRQSFAPWDLVTSLAWSPDGSYLAAGVGERVEIYQSPDLQPLASFETGALSHGLAFSPDGAWLAAGSRDGWLRAWFVHALFQQGTMTGEPEFALQAHKKGVNTLAFSPDGELLSSGGNDAVARFWDLASGERVGQVVGGTFAVPSIAFLPDGKSLAIVNGNVIRLREVGSERITGSFQADAPLYSVTISPDGQTLAAGDNANHVLLWQVSQAYRTGQERYPDPLMFAGHNGRSGSYPALVWQVVFSPDGRLLASAGGDASVRIWDAARGELLATLSGYHLAVTCVAFSPDGRFLASGSLDGTLRLEGVMR